MKQKMIIPWSVDQTTQIFSGDRFGSDTLVRVFSVSLISDTFFGLFVFMTSAKYFIYKALNIWLINYKETSFH